MSNKISKKNGVVASNKDYTAPEYRRTAFHCPHCNVCAHHEWSFICVHNPSNFLIAIRAYLFRKCYNHRLNEDTVENILCILSKVYKDTNFIKDCDLSFCDYCKKYSIWVNKKIVYPHLSTAPLPVAEMPESVKELYSEARTIANQSPRGACALLRLAIHRLIKELGEDENNLSTAIGNLVKKGLPEKIQKALDTVRVIGNNAVHPGEINIKDNPEIANSLFMLVNFIYEKMIIEGKKVNAIYSFLPKKKIEAINNRDNRMNNKHELTKGDDE